VQCKHHSAVNVVLSRISIMRVSIADSGYYYYYYYAKVMFAHSHSENSHERASVSNML